MLCRFEPSSGCEFVTHLVTPVSLTLGPTCTRKACLKHEILSIRLASICFSANNKPSMGSGSALQKWALLPTSNHQEPSWPSYSRRGMQLPPPAPATAAASPGSVKGNRAATGAASVRAAARPVRTCAWCPIQPGPAAAGAGCGDGGPGEEQHGWCTRSEVPSEWRPAGSGLATTRTGCTPSSVSWSSAHCHCPS